MTIKKITTLLFIFIFATSGFGLVMRAQSVYADPCPEGGFLGLPSWQHYLEGEMYDDEETGKKACAVKLDGINSIWKIVAAVIDILLRIAALVAIGFVVYGGGTYTLSQGSPDTTKKALSTTLNALVGIVISIIAAALVGFIAGRFS